MFNCYICGAENATQPLALKESFTGHSRCKCPESSHWCDRCSGLFSGEFQYAFYKEKAIFTRCFSWILENPYELTDTKNKPYLGDWAEAKKRTARIAHKVPNRADIRHFIINPPAPPFQIVIATSGQKHTLPFAVTAQSRELFPVLLEETLIYVYRAEFTELLSNFESLMTLGFSKSEITSGDYRSDRLSKCLSEWQEIEPKIQKYRGTDLMALADHVACLTDNNSIAHN